MAAYQTYKNKKFHQNLGDFATKDLVQYANASTSSGWSVDDERKSLDATEFSTEELKNKQMGVRAILRESFKDANLAQACNALTKAINDTNTALGQVAVPATGALEAAKQTALNEAITLLNSIVTSMFDDLTDTAKFSDTQASAVIDLPFFKNFTAVIKKLKVVVSPSS